MDTVLIQLNEEIEALTEGLRSRRKARRNWMERLMQDDDGTTAESAESQDTQTPGDQRDVHH